VDALPQLVREAIDRHRGPADAPVLLACSGGLDSQVLLHAVAAILPAAEIWVGHVHHGLQPEADAWLAFTEAAARALGVNFLSRRLPPLPPRPDGGIEAWARRHRYRALADMAAAAGATLVVTAHHANDQLETHLLRRLRGAGPLGLGAMRMAAPLPGAPQRLLLRPMLGVERRRILDYASRHRLDWIEDPSNQDSRYARNRARREIEQSLLADPQGLARRLAEVGELQRAADASRRQARADLDTVRLLLLESKVPPSPPASPPTPLASLPSPSPLPQSPLPQSPPPLSRAALARLPAARAAEALRLWLQEIGLRMPTRAKLAEILRQLVAADSSHASLRHDGRWLLRYRDRIDVIETLPTAVAPTVFRWRGESLMTIAGQQFLFRRVEAGEGIDSAWLAQADLLLDRGRGKDRIRLRSDQPSRSWKNLLQEHGVPPWLRPALPVLRHRELLLHAAPFGSNRQLPAWGPRASGGQQANEGQQADDGRQPRGDQKGAGDRIAIDWLAPAAWARWL
jgi:tRNA(Ile)-lysidine synthase